MRIVINMPPLYKPLDEAIASPRRDVVIECSPCAKADMALISDVLVRSFKNPASYLILAPRVSAYRVRMTTWLDSCGHKIYKKTQWGFELMNGSRIVFWDTGAIDSVPLDTVSHLVILNCDGVEKDLRPWIAEHCIGISRLAGTVAAHGHWYYQVCREHEEKNNATYYRITANDALRAGCVTSDYLKRVRSTLSEAEYARRWNCQHTSNEAIPKEIEEALKEMEASVGAPESWKPLLLPKRWRPLRAHSVQQRLWTSKARFRTVPAGRRSGKTELAKRFIVKEAIKQPAGCEWRYIVAAPTHRQAKTIYWKDLKRLVPQFCREGKPSETELIIRLWNGAEICVIGMDRPERVEGAPIGGIVLDEYADMSDKAWADNVRPGLSDTGGWAWLIGVPEGRNHYHKICEKAKTDPTGEWQFFTWISADILPPEEIQKAKEDLDEQTYRQEYEAAFETFEGRAYWSFSSDPGCNVAPTQYDPKLDLHLCFDFNVEPGVAVALQEQNGFTVAIGEVYIPRNSTTPAVCRKLLAMYGGHEGRVYLYGDSTGGARGSAKTEGSDWDIIKRELGAVYVGRLYSRVPDKNPDERVRVNAVLSRCCSMTGQRRLIVGPQCKYLIRDLEGVVLLKGGSGEIDKKYSDELTHISDALGYYIVKRFPVTGRKHVVSKEY